MKSDKLLKQFQKKGLKSKFAKTTRLDGLKKIKDFQPIDSGKLLSIKGGGDFIDPKVVRTN